MRRPRIAVGLALAAGCLGSGSAAGIEEITVTARKLAEPYRLVPLAIDVLGRDRLVTASVADLAALARTAPGLYFESLWGGAGSAPTLRAQAQPSTAGDNVGVFVDGVYQAERTAVDAAPLDVERIEVVHGPQSALFGHSTFTGAIHYVPRAPTATPSSGFSVGAGTDEYLEAGGFLSGPVTDRGLLGRFAAATRAAGGAWPDAVTGERHGGTSRDALAGTLALDRGGPAVVRLSARWFETASDHPAQVFVDGQDYDCGAVEARSGEWSYFCGPLPHAGPVSLSAGLPESRNEAAQAALAVEWSAGALDFGSVTSYYRGRSDIVRDFDSSSVGEVFGVCRFRVNCPVAGEPELPVSRFVTVNSVSRQRPETTEWNQEFRLSGRAGSRVDWLLGIAGFAATAEDASAFGAARGDLAPDEALTVVLPLTPELTGPLARGNSALVNDPNRGQVLLSRSRTTRRTLAVFGAATWRPFERLGLRAEMRSTRERTKVDSITANFVPSFGTAIPAQEFTDTTPRFSVDYAPADGALVYASAAKGSRSGGVNLVPGLLPEEQGYEPEYNWTYELAARYRRPDGRWQASATLYRIDWQNTQIVGLPTTPGVANLITRNTAGIRTDGIELSFEAQVLERLSVHGAYSHAEPEFVAGSDDPGSSGFCGLRGGNRTSSFCVIGPPRSGLAPPGTLVPYVDGNTLQRAPTEQWLLGLAAQLPALAAGWRALAALDWSGQDDVYDRSIDGARYGARKLLSARFALLRGGWTLELWGTNLMDERYVRAVASRGAAFYPATPRPLDLVLGDRRRIGLTLRFER